MANNTTLNPGVAGDTIATEDISGIKHELVKVEFGADGVATKVSAANPLPVTDLAAELTLASIDAGIPAALGQTTMAASMPVAISSNQSAIPVSSTVTDTAPATQNITAQDVVSTTTAVANAQNFITGSPTANSAASFVLVSGFDTIRFLVTGVWTGTLSIEMSMDGGITWTTQGVHQTGSTYTAAAFTQNFTGHNNGAAFTNARVRATAAWTGTATVKIVQTVNPATVYIANSVKISDVTIPSQQLSISAAGAALARIDQTTPGTTNGVQVNAALPVGANVIGKVSIDQTTPGTTNRVDIADSLNNPVSAFPATFLRVTDEPHQLFYDPFDTAIDTTNRWTSSTGSSGVAAANTSGVMAMGTGTVANGYSKLNSQPTFTPTIPAWLGVSDAIALPDGAAPLVNSYRYWGTGTTPGTPTVATPITDGYGFELGIDGKLRAVVYAAGTRTVVQDLSTSGNSTQPLDAAYHRYIIYIRTDRAYWYIDGLTSAQLVATSNFQSSAVQSLPRLFLCVGNSTPPVSNTQIQCTGATAWDTGKNNVQISDGTFPWRKSKVTSTGAINTIAGAASAAALSTVAASATNVTLLAANTSRIGAMIVNDGTINLYVKFGATATTASYTVLIYGGSYYEFPSPIYQGIVDGIWSSASGNARITEMT